MTTRIAVIGSAGRQQDAQLVSRPLFNAMVRAASDRLLRWDKDPTNSKLVSGGAAFSDHVAVSLHFKYSWPLELWFPCSWDHQGKQFLDTGKRDFRVNPGGTSNFHHRNFSRSMGVDPNHSLETLDKLWQLSRIKNSLVTIHLGEGFFDRNNGVAKVERLIAFTRGTGNVPCDGGTADTWGKSKAGTKVHIPLGSLL